MPSVGQSGDINHQALFTKRRWTRQTLIHVATKNRGMQINNVKMVVINCSCILTKVLGYESHDKV